MHYSLSCFRLIKQNWSDICFLFSDFWTWLYNFQFYSVVVKIYFLSMSHVGYMFSGALCNTVHGCVCVRMCVFSPVLSGCRHYSWSWLLWHSSGSSWKMACVTTMSSESSCTERSRELIREKVQYRKSKDSWLLSPSWQQTSLRASQNVRTDQRIWVTLICADPVYRENVYWMI